jgi:hypothetical protein
VIQHHRTAHLGVARDLLEYLRHQPAVAGQHLMAERRFEDAGFQLSRVGAGRNGVRILVA